MRFGTVLSIFLFGGSRYASCGGNIPATFPVCRLRFRRGRFGTWPLRNVRFSKVYNYRTSHERRGVLAVSFSRAGMSFAGRADGEIRFDCCSVDPVSGTEFSARSTKSFLQRKARKPSRERRCFVKSVGEEPSRATESETRSVIRESLRSDFERRCGKISPPWYEPRARNGRIRPFLTKSPLPEITPAGAISHFEDLSKRPV